jgi:protoporphyrin/coproporphyrin ferrochelatase
MSTDSMSQKSAILLLAHGTPDKLSDMAEYLQNVTGGRHLPQEVIEDIQHRYAQIGLTETKPGLHEDGLPEGPPLTRWTLLQGRLLSELLSSGEQCRPVYVAMRNWYPLISEVVAQMKADGVQHARVLCLAPQNSRTSTGLYRRSLMAAVGNSFTVDFISGWADEPLLAQAFAERLWPVWAEACAATSAAAGEPVRVPILFTAHAVPCRTIMASVPSLQPDTQPAATIPADGIQNYGSSQNPDPYPVECKQTTLAIAAALRPLGLTDADWFFAFQSQGIAGAPWIGPTVPDTLKALADSGHKAVVLQPVGFLCDHVEILYDIDIDFKAQAKALGMKLWRAESLNASPTLIRAIDRALHRPAAHLNPRTAPEPSRGRPA